VLEAAEPELAGETGLKCRDFVFEGVVIGQDAPRPQHQPFTFRSEALKALPAPYQRNLQLVFELADGFGQRRLGHVAGARGAGEVPLSSERDEVLELAKQHHLFDHARSTPLPGGHSRVVPSGHVLALAGARPGRVERHL
jgi:hypothetical protein